MGDESEGVQECRRMGCLTEEESEGICVVVGGWRAGEWRICQLHVLFEEGRSMRRRGW